MHQGVLNWRIARVAMLAVLACGRLMAAAPMATTMQGRTAGMLMTGGKVRAFLGLPYAAPPVGQLRWKAPQKPAAWKGVRSATKYGARCEQWPIWADYIFQDAGPSEDCLYLNVYAPATANARSRLPVMFWIHSGGYTAGAGSEPRYTSSALPQSGVILVTINYRLGVFGFLACDDLAKEGDGSAGNYGLMDMVAALQWVKTNIAAFGGDPNNVTIFGESAGSFAVSTLMAAPSAQGLFQKAIGESGAAFGAALPLTTLAAQAQREQAWADSVGAHSLADLRSMSASALLEAARKEGVGAFAPVIDGRFVPDNVSLIYSAGKQAHVPLLAGWNRDERAGTLSKGMTAAKWKAYAAEHYGARANDFLKAFPANNDDEAARSADDFTTNQFIALGTWQWIEAHTKTGQVAVYRYKFDLPATPSEMHPEGKYAFHSDELEYVFSTLATRHGAQWRPEDRKLSELMVRYWSNFARSGDPNGEGLPHWPRYDKDAQLIELDKNVTSGPDASRDQFEFMIQR
jgi:para-nitrobenzyl esterase